MRLSQAVDTVPQAGQAMLRLPALIPVFLVRVDLKVCGLTQLGVTALFYDSLACY